MPTYMKAWNYVAPGGTMVDRIKKTDKAIKPDATSLTGSKILIRVKAVSINPVDYKMPQLGCIARAIMPFPKTLATDCAGVVVAVGPAAKKDIQLGDHVIARIGFYNRPGTLSEYIVSDRDGYAVIDKTVSLEQAACLGTAALTAYQCIHPYVKRGDSIFINGGSGGVGTFGIQIGKLLGCHVTVSCSTAKASMCISLGADEVVDYKTTSVIHALHNLERKYSLVVDLVGNSPKYFHVSASDFLTEKGVFILTTPHPTIEGLISVGDALLRPGLLGGSRHKVVLYAIKNNHADLASIAGWLCSGRLKVQIDRRFGFEHVVDAFQHLGNGSAAGNIVIQVD